ncbi:MAG: hypothetical protein F4X64_03340 [Chloroflexi bacterium]|nr:hypothetical protein [Chloroflexota bacterium]
MVNRNKQELDLVRRYYDPDDLEDTSPLRNRVSWLGLRLRVGAVIGVGFGNAALMVVLVVLRWQFGDRIPWLPAEDIRFDIAFLVFIVVMSFVSFTMFRAATNMFRQEIREIDTRMARRDHATEEEVQEFVSQSERQMNRRMTRRWIVILAVIVPIFPIFGTKLIFPWGGMGALAGATFLTMALICAGIYFSSDVSRLLGRLGRRMRN